MNYQSNYMVPIYEYSCLECQMIYEICHPITEQKDQFCEHCKSKLKKLISQSSFRLIGSDWYKPNEK